MTKVDICVPSFGESIREVRLGHFHVETGESVREGQDLVDLETEKLNQALPASASGVVTWRAREGDTVLVGAPIGSIEGGASAEGEHPVREKKPDDGEKPVVVEQPPAERQGAEEALSIYEQPEEVQQVGREKGFEEAESSGERRATSDRMVEKRGEKSRMSPLREAISRRLVQVCQETAMVTTFQEVDLQRIVKIREENKEAFLKAFQLKLGWMSFFVHASAKALERFPRVNSSVSGSDIVTWNTIDIGVAVSTEKGVVVPVLRGANKMSFAEIEGTIDQVADKARSGKLELSDIEGGTFTITNGGVFGSLFSTPLLNPPQSAILGMHTIQKRAVVVEDEIVIRPMMYLALTYDHRIIDGQEAVTFLSKIKTELENPERIFLGL